MISVFGSPVANGFLNCWQAWALRKVYLSMLSDLPASLSDYAIPVHGLLKVEQIYRFDRYKDGELHWKC